MLQTYLPVHIVGGTLPDPFGIMLSALKLYSFSTAGRIDGAIVFKYLKCQ
jgi:hypothetical protein